MISHIIHRLIGGRNYGTLFKANPKEEFYLVDYLEKKCGMMETKKKKESSAARKMPEAERGPEAEKAVQRLLDSECFKTAAAIYTYVGFRGEVGTDDLIRAAWKDGKRLAFRR